MAEDAPDAAAAVEMVEFFTEGALDPTMIQDVAGQLAKSSGGDMVSLDAIQKEDVGNVLGQLMTVQMSTEAHIDTGNLQQVLGFLVGAVRTLASGAQDAKAREEELIASQKLMAQQLEDANAANADDEAAKAAAAAAALAAAEQAAADAAALAEANQGMSEEEKAAAAAAAAAAAEAAAAALAAANASGAHAEEGIASLQSLAENQAAALSKLTEAHDALAAQNAELLATLEALRASMDQLQGDAAAMSSELKNTQNTLQEEVARRGKRAPTRAASCKRASSSSSTLS